MAKKRHHFIPQVYLREFCDPNDPGFLWMYKKEGGPIVRTQPVNVGVESNLYTVAGLDGESDTDSLENIFCKVEARFPEFAVKVKAGESMERRDRETFIRFAGLMLARNPHYSGEIGRMIAAILKVESYFSAAHPEYFDKEWEGMKKAGYDVDDSQKEAIRQMLISEDYELEINRAYRVTSALMSLKTITNLLWRMRWDFYLTGPSKPFVTCDNPVFYDDPTADPRYLITRGIGLGNPNTHVIFPIASTVAALGSWAPDSYYIDATPECVSEINSRIIFNASRFVYASYKSYDLDTAVKEHKGTGFRIRSG